MIVVNYGIVENNCLVFENYSLVAVKLVDGEGAYAVTQRKGKVLSAYRIVNSLYILVYLDLGLDIIKRNYFVDYLDKASLGGSGVYHVYAISLFFCLLYRGNAAV